MKVRHWVTVIIAACAAPLAHAYYGPDILTFGSGDSLTDLSARAEIQVAPQWVASVGMRWFEFDLTEGGGERTLQEEMFVGIGYGFQRNEHGHRPFTGLCLVPDLRMVRTEA